MTTKQIDGELRRARSELEQQHWEDLASASRIAGEVVDLASDVDLLIRSGERATTDGLHARLRDLDRALAALCISTELNRVLGRLRDLVPADGS
jgi:hypothetical protein